MVFVLDQQKPAYTNQAANPANNFKSSINGFEICSGGTTKSLADAGLFLLWLIFSTRFPICFGVLYTPAAQREKLGEQDSKKSPPTPAMGPVLK